MPIELNIKPRKGTDSVRTLSGPTIQIGRNPDADITFDDDGNEAVSWDHAQIELTKSGPVLSDLQSTNGTFLNGDRLHKPTKLSVLDTIALGQTGPELTVRSIPAHSDGVSFASKPENRDRRRLFGVPILSLGVLFFALGGVAGFVAVQPSSDQKIVQNNSDSSSLSSGPGPENDGERTGEIDPAPLQPAATGEQGETLGVSDSEPVPPNPSQPGRAKKDNLAPGGDEKVDGNASDSPDGNDQPPRKDEELGQLLDQTDFVLVDQPDLAVLVDAAESDAAFRVVGKMEGGEAADVIEKAFKNGKPRVAGNGDLARDVFHKVNVGGRIPTELALNLTKCWRLEPFLPVDDSTQEFVTFRERGAGQLYRVGYYLGHTQDDPATDVVELVTLSGKREKFSRQSIEPGTGKVGEADRIMETVGEMDFLEFGLLNIAKALGQELPRHVKVAVYVDVDALEPTSYVDPTSESYKTFRAIMVDLGINSVFVRRDDAIRALQTFRKHLEDEIVNNLTKLGVEVLEREELETIIGEREFAFTDQPSIHSKAAHFEAKTFGHLACVSHVIFAELYSPLKRGTYHINLRLVDANSGTVIWGEKRDREIHPPSKANRYLLDSGKLSKIQFANGRTGRQPPFKLLAHRNGEDVWLAYVETENDNEIVIRDLFSERSRHISRNAVKSINYVTSVNDVPAGHHFRHIVLELARRAMPIGGRVTEVRDKNAVVGLTRNAGITPTDRLKAIRLLSTGNGEVERRILDVELNILEAHDTHSIAKLNDFDLKPLWSEPLAVGDIVVKKGAQQPLINFGQLELGDPRKEATVMSNLRIGNNWTRARLLYEKTKSDAEILSEKLPKGLRLLGIGVISSPEEAARVDAITHLASVKVIPIAAAVTITKYKMSVSIQPVARPDLKYEISCDVSADDIREWSP